MALRVACRVFLLSTVLCLCVFASEEIKVKTTIAKPENCVKSDTWLEKGRKYHYIYKTQADSTFVGTTDSLSAFKLLCHVHVEVRRKCEAYLKVSDCSISERKPGGDDIYEEIPSSSTKITELLNKHQLYFQFNKGQVVPGSIVVSVMESLKALNIKRGILSALQTTSLDVGEQYSPDDPFVTNDIFGSCPISYWMGEDGYIHTKRDITVCHVPQIFYRQTSLFSLIKTLYGGYRQTEVSELIYPFASTVDCKYLLQNNKLRESICVQQQYFKPAAFNGTQLATCVTNIRQSLVLQSAKRLKKRGIDRTMAHKKVVPLLFEFHEEDAVQVTKADINNYLEELVKQFSSNTIDVIPAIYRNMLRIFRNADAQILREIMTDIYDCHGITCNNQVQVLKADYFTDGLLSCGTENCLATFVSGIKDSHISQLMTYIFSYDLALHHKPTLAVIREMLEVCKKTKKISCWLPLSIMINKGPSKFDTVTVLEPDSPIYQTLLYIRQTMGDTCKTGVIDTLAADQMKEKVDELSLMIKVVGNIGIPVQEVFDDNPITDSEKSIVASLLQCGKNPKIPEKISKMAIMALHKMEVDSEVEETLLEILGDVNRPPGVRTVAFARLAVVAYRGIMWSLLDQIHTETMESMKTYMVSYIDSLLENDQPDLSELRQMWKESINGDERPWPKVASTLLGKSRYFEFSSYFKLPLSVNISGLQMEVDVVYDIGSPVVHSANLKISHYDGEKLPLIELGIDVDGLETLINTFVGRADMDFKTFLSIMAQHFMSPQMNEGVDDTTIFSGFDKDVVAKIVKLLKRANFPKIDFPDGILYWKILGHEVCYLEVRDVIKMVMSSGAGVTEEAAGKLEYFLQRLHQGIKLARSRSLSLVDIIKVLPTVGGFPLNMTVSVVGSLAADIGGKLDLSQFVRKTGPAEVEGAIITNAAAGFIGEISMMIPDLTSCGSSLHSDLLFRENITGLIHYQKGATSKDKPQSYFADLSINNVDDDYVFGKLNGKLYLHHHSGVEEILGDPLWETTDVKCTPGVVSGTKVCLQATYPNVTSSTSHAYFPLSGPSDIQLVASKADTNTHVWSASYEVFNETNSERNVLTVNFTSQGQKLKRKVNSQFIYNKDENNALFTVDIPEAQTHFKFQLKDYEDTQTPPAANTGEYLADMQLRSGDRTLFRSYFRKYTRVAFVVEGNGIKFGEKEVTIQAEFATPGVSTRVDMFKMDNSVEHHYKKSMNVTYYCAKWLPMLYMLHWSPELAAQNEDTTKYVLVNDAIVGYNIAEDSNLWKATDNLFIDYPGQTITLHNEMESNDTHAHRNTTITYYSSKQQLNTIRMKAQVSNFSDSSKLLFDYYMTVSHTGWDYDFVFQGHLHGSWKDLSFNTDVTRKSKSNEGLQKAEEILELSPVVGAKPISSQKNSYAEQLAGMKCVPVDNNEAKISLDVNLKAKAVLEGRVPVGIEFGWDVLYAFPRCWGHTNYTLSGKFGKRIKNDIRNFAYWINGDSLYTIHIKGNRKQEPMVKTSTSSLQASVKRLQHQYFNFLLDYSCQSLNFSTKIDYLAMKPRAGSIQVVSFLSSPFSFFNYNNSQNMDFIYENEALTINHEEFTSTSWFDLALNTSVVLGNDVSSITQHGYFISRLLYLPGRTGIESTFEMSKTTLPKLHVVFQRPGVDNFLDASLSNDKLLNLTFSHQRTGRNEIYEFSWLIELVGSTTVKHLVDWNPLLTSVGYNGMKGVLRSAGESIILASENIKLNTQKPFAAMVIPFTNKTIGMWYAKIIRPVLKYLPFAKARFGDNDKRPNQKYDSNDRQQPAHAARTAMEGIQKCPTSWPRFVFVGTSKIFATIMKTLGQALKESPGMMQPFLSNVLMPKIRSAMNDHQIEFIVPTGIKWRNFISIPSTTHGQVYLQQLFRKFFLEESNHSDDISLIYNRKYIVTFDRKLYKISDEYTMDCTHLLAADFDKKNFALLASRQGLTLVTDQTSVTVGYDGNVFHDDCSVNAHLPFSSSDNKVNVVNKNSTISVATEYGISIICDIPGDLCSIYMSPPNYNHSLGLLGSNDKEQGSDFRQVNGKITQNKDGFTASYAVSGPDKCYYYNEYNDESEEEDECFNVELMNECSRQFDEISEWYCRHFIPYEPFKDACIADANSCSRDDTSICKHAQAYHHLCSQKSLFAAPVNCSESASEVKTSSFPTDIIILAQSENDLDWETPVGNLLGRLQATTGNVQIGIIRYHSSKAVIFTDALDPHSFPDRYMINLDDLEIWDANSIWRRMWQISSSMNDGLMKAMKYPFRMNSQKMVVLFSNDRTPTLPSMASIRETFKSKSIVFDAFASYDELSPAKIFGVNYDGSVIGRRVQGKTVSLPENDLTELVKDTHGAVFDSQPMIHSRKQRINHIVRYITNQIAIARC